MLNPDGLYKKVDNATNAIRNLKQKRLLQLQEQKRLLQLQEQKRQEQEQKLNNATNVIRNLQNNKQRKLIFLVGPTGSGKSKLKDTIINDFPIGNNNYISVDDFFEEDSNSKDIFYKLYKYHFNNIDFNNNDNNDDNNDNKKFIKCISQNIYYNDYLEIIKTELGKADITDCVIPQIKKRYGLKNGIIPFSQFTSAVYFALREKYLNKKFDELIKDCIDRNKDIIIESNGEHINSIIGWYQETKDKEEVTADDFHCKTPSLDLRDKINKKYKKNVYFLYRPVDEIKKSMISRAFINMNNFLNNKDEYNIPRLPEIEDDILKEKIQKICLVYDEINEKKDTYGITTLNVYNNLYEAGIVIDSAPDHCCCDNEDNPCTDGPCKNNGGRGKKRKKYTQKKQRHFKTRRNYKAKKSRKKKTRKRNRKIRRH